VTQDSGNTGSLIHCPWWYHGGVALALAAVPPLQKCPCMPEHTTQS
jgi:hypothetical protein